MNDGIYTVESYIECKATVRDKIKAIDALIDKFELKLLEVGDSVVYDEYSMNDGQMNVRTKYRSSNDVLQAIDNLEKLKQRYVNKLNGRTVVLRSGNI
jgi:hypothetical protein